MGKIIGILNQKGGVGKSVLAQHLANALYHNLNYDKNPKFVALYDSDSPQYSILSTRKEESQIVEALLEDGNNFYNDRLKKIYTENFPPINIYSGNIKEVTEKQEVLRSNYEYSIIDVVGTVNTDGYDEDFINIFDYIIVPTNNDFDVIRSSISFIHSIIAPICKKSNGRMKYGIVFNNVDSVEEKSYTGIIEELRSSGFVVLDTIINRRKKYARLYMSEGSSKGQLSTLFPTFERPIIDLMEEIIKNIKN